MRWSVAILLSLLAASGCAPLAPDAMTGSPDHPVAVVYENPALVPVADHTQVWETVVDVVEDVFTIEREEPVRQYGDVLTEGRLDTLPQVGSTILEPWHHDAVNLYEKIEGTLQSVRRQATVRVTPAQGGQWISVVVVKELEDTSKPLQASAGSATFRYDNSLSRVVNPVVEQETARGWIPMGRDTALEQALIAEIQSRLSGPPPCRVPLTSLPRTLR